jgi:type IV pilus assembly protein PilW
MARLQENARYAFTVIARDIRGAGFVGCNPTLNNLLDETDADYDDHLNDFQAGIDGWEYTASGTAPGNDYTITSVSTTGAVGDWAGVDWPSSGTDLAGVLANRVIQGTDVLVTKSVQPVMDGAGAYLVQQGTNPPNATSITFTSNTGIEKGAILIFGDCDRGDVFQNGSGPTASNVNRNAGVAGIAPGNKNPASVQWSHSCTNCQISETQGKVYYIGAGVSGEPALFRYDYSLGSAGATVDELVEGIESMQILFGEDLNTSDQDIQPTRYVTANNITNADNVVSVRISLLVRTPEPLPVQNKEQGWNRTFRLHGVDDATGVDITTQDDQRVRKVFTTTIFMRNKGVTRERS